MSSLRVFLTGLAGVLLLASGTFISGCGANASSLFARAGLFPNQGTGPTIPPPADDTGDDDQNNDNNQDNTSTTICITFDNGANEDARVFMYASPNLLISFSDLTTDNDNLEALPIQFQECVDQDDIVGNRAISVLLVDGQLLRYQIDCGRALSMAFGVAAAAGNTIFIDELFGPLRQGVDFFCGDDLVVNVTDSDGDETFEISF